jgi:hypothetical protein
MAVLTASRAAMKISEGRTSIASRTAAQQRLG